MGIVKGKVTDASSGKPVPGATVSAVRSDTWSTLAAVAADGSGNYALNSPNITPGMSIVITSVGYQPVSYPVHSSNAIIDPELEREVLELPGVIAPVRPKMNKAVLIGGAALLALLALKKKGKKRVGGLLPGGALMDAAMPIVLVGGITIILIYGPKIMELLGLKKPKAEQDVEDAISDPGSYWDPSFWKKGPVGSTLVLKGQAVADLIRLLENAFGWFNDDEAAVINAFKTFKTQSQLSYFADQFQQKKGKRLADWLFADSYPDDRLSLSEMAEINKYIEKLPKFKP